MFPAGGHHSALVGRHVASQAPPPGGEAGRGLPRRMGRAPPRHGQQRAAQAHPGAYASVGRALSRVVSRGLAPEEGVGGQVPGRLPAVDAGLWPWPGRCRRQRLKENRPFPGCNSLLGCQPPSFCLPPTPHPAASPRGTPRPHLRGRGAHRTSLQVPHGPSPGPGA